MEKEIDKYLQDVRWTEKIKQLKFKKRFYTITRIIAITIIIFALGLLGHRMILYLKSTHIFSINDIVVEGNKILSVEEILQTGEIVNVKNIFEINLKELEAKLLLHPRIKTVSVKRKLPNILLISIEERTPIALLNVKEEFLYKLYEIDNEGYIIGEDNKISNYDLPVITGLNTDNIMLGTRIDDSQILNMLEVIHKVNGTIFNFERYIAEITKNTNLDKPETIMILNQGNVPVFFGYNFILERLIKLNSLLMVVMEKLDNIEYIDFRYNDAVIKWK